MRGSRLNSWARSENSHRTPTPCLASNPCPATGLKCPSNRRRKRLFKDVGSTRIRAGEPWGESIRRAACEQIDAAITASCSERNGNESPVHQTRKHLKEARAAIRLLAVDVPRAAFRRENRRLRDVGRLVSGIRDAEVRLETVKELRGFGARGNGSFEQAEVLLAFELNSFLEAFAGWQGEALGKLKRARRAIVLWHLDAVTPRSLCRGVRRSYRAGRDALKAAKKKGSARRFHELRKRSKQLWYQLRLLQALNPPVFRKRCKKLKKVGEFLGRAHDLCFVAERLQGMPGAPTRKRGRTALKAMLASREKELHRTALGIAEKFYARKPKDFAARIAGRYTGFQPVTSSGLPVRSDPARRMPARRIGLEA